MQHFFQGIQGWFTYPGLYSEMVEKFTDGAVFVEVGAWKGKSAAYMAVEIINSNKKIDFYVVDTWEGSKEHVDETSPHYEPLLKTQDALYNHFLKNISQVSNIKVNRNESHLAANDFEDESIDFVFIDAAHDYDNVVRDIKAWLPKIKKTGIISGHDIGLGTVKKAVSDTIGIFNVSGEQNIWFAVKLEQGQMKN